MIFNKRNIFLFLVSGYLSLFSSYSMAKSITLYDQPKANAKIAGSINSDKGIVTIFTPKDSDWVKIADPTNGNVGWVKASDLSGAGFSYNMMTTGSGPKSSQIIQFNGWQQLNSQEMRNAVQQLYKQQQAVEKEMQKNMHDLFTVFNQQLQNFPGMVVPQPVANTKTTVSQPNANTQPNGQDGVNTGSH